MPRPSGRRSSGAASARLAAPEAKAAEAAEFDFLLAAERLGDAAEHGLDDDFGTLLREVGDVGHLLDERRLRQSVFGHGFVCRQKYAVAAVRARESPPGDTSCGRMMLTAA